MWHGFWNYTYLTVDVDIDTAGNWELNNLRAAIAVAALRTPAQSEAILTLSDRILQPEVGVNR